MKSKNKKQTRKIWLVMLACASMMMTMTPSFGCAFSTDPYFSYTNHPDFPLKEYAAGKLGIVQSGYARSYLIVAYRYLSGQPLTVAEQQAMVSLWDNRLLQAYNDTSSDTAAWLKIRATIPGVTKLERIDTERSVSSDESWQLYCNCQLPAFNKAAETLNALVGKFGAGSPEVKEWLSAQDQVFNNCGDPSYADKKTPVTIPQALPASANDTLKKHRAYQIAAANFYAQKYQAATIDFEQISGDSASPWKDIAGYLAVRSMLRQATLPKQVDKVLLQEAQKRIKQLLSNPDMAKIHADITALNDYVMARLSPEQHLLDLTKQSLSAKDAGEVTKTLDLLLGGDDSEVSALKYASLPAAAKKQDMIDWIVTYQSDDDAANKHAIERWKQTHSLPWLVAAAAAVDAKSPDASAVMSAAEKEQSPFAKWSLFESVNSINIDRGKSDVARAALDKVLSAPPADLPISSLNQLKTQRLPLSRNLEEFLRFGVQTPAAVSSSGGTDGVPDDVEDREKGKIEKTAPLFTPEAGYVLDTKLPLRVLKLAAQNKDLPTNLKSNVAWTSFVRAVLIEDEAMARSLAPIMRPFNKDRQKLIDGYLAASTADDRKFAAAFMILQFSSGQPNASSGVMQDDGYGDSSGWWWGDKPLAGEPMEGVEKIDPGFLTAADKGQAKAELAKLAKVANAPNWLTRIVLARAKSNPTDPRLPQALHFAVKCTRYGSTDGQTTTLSKQAFTVLHTKFKSSTWTKQTPYWY